LEIGDSKQRPGARNDFEPFKEDVKAGMSWGDLQDKHDQITASYEKWCYAYFHRHRPKSPPDPDFEPRDWHKYVHAAIANPCKRFIHFFVDEVGGVGKSFLCDHLRDTRDDVQKFTIAKLDAMQCLVDESAKVFLIDCPHSRKDVHLPYDFLEGLKSSETLSPKCSPVMKQIQRPNTVIVFMNEVPDTEHLSHDRFKVWFRRKVGWVQASLHPEAVENLNHRGKWVIPPVEGDDVGETIFRVNSALQRQNRKRKAEAIQDAHRELQHQLTLQKVEDLERRNNVSGIPHDNRFGHYGGIEGAPRLE